MTLDSDEPLKFDHSDPSKVALVHEMYSEFRERCPVAWGEKFGGFWALTRYDDVQMAARDSETFTTTEGITIPALHGGIKMIPAGVDPPDHAKYRRLIQRFFMPPAMKSYEEPLRTATREHLATVSQQHEADLVQVLCRTIPPAAIAWMFGLPLSDAARFVDWTERLMATGFAGDLEGNERTSNELQDYLEARCLERRGSDDGSVLAGIANGEFEGRLLNSDEIRGMTHLLAVAGHETTVNGLATMLYNMIVQPGLKARLIDDPALIPAMVEEVLRYDSPVMSMARTVVKETTVGDQKMCPADKVLLAFISANRDGSHFEDPDDFVVPRSPNPHLGFGTGAHKCIGEHLARMEMRIVAEEVLQHMPDVQLAADYEPDWLPARTVRGLRTLRVAYTPWQ